MTAALPCTCAHPKTQHRGQAYGCRALDCGCARYEPDLQAPAVGTLDDELAALEATDPTVGEAAARLDETTAAILAKAATMPTLSASAELRRVEQERDSLRSANISHLGLLDRRNVELRLERDAQVKLRQRLLAAEAELVSARTELEQLRTDRSKAYAANGELLDELERDVGAEIARHVRYLCETCGSRYGKPYTDHEHGPLTPVLVTITRVTA